MMRASILTILMCSCILCGSAIGAICQEQTTEENEVLSLIPSSTMIDWQMGPADRARFDKILIDGEKYLPIIERLVGRFIEKNEWARVENSFPLIALSKSDRKHITLKRVFSKLHQVHDNASNSIIGKRVERLMLHTIGALGSFADPLASRYCIDRIQLEPGPWERAPYLDYLTRAFAGDLSISKKLEEITEDKNSKAYRAEDVREAITRIRKNGV